MIVVVGGGPSGLATAYYLQQRKLPYRVLERQAVGCAWRHHYDRLHLNTLRQVSALPGLPMPRDYPRFPSAAQYAAYLESYVCHWKLAVETGVDVQRAVYQEGEWRLETNRGLVTAETLVLATGIWSTPYQPRFGGEESFGGTILHSREYRNPQAFQGQRVLVVGAGNSGAEIAVDLGEHGVTTAIAIRDGVFFVPRTESLIRARVGAWLYRHLPYRIAARVLGDSRARQDFSHLGLHSPAISVSSNAVVGFALPEAVAAGKVTVYPCLGQFIPGGVRFVDGREAAFDTVILATGFRPTLQIVTEELELDSRGYPILVRGRSRRNTHLFCVGFTYPTTEGFLQALPRAARSVVAQIAKQRA